MSNQDIKPVPTATGTFAVVKLSPAKDGSSAPESGNKMPATEKVEVEKLTKQLNTINQSIGRDLRFEIDMNSGKSVIQVLDRETGEIIRQIPPENAKTYVSGNGDVALRLYDKRV